MAFIILCHTYRVLDRQQFTCSSCAFKLKLCTCLASCVCVCILQQLCCYNIVCYTEGARWLTLESNTLRRRRRRRHRRRQTNAVLIVRVCYCSTGLSGDVCASGRTLHQACTAKRFGTCRRTRCGRRRRRRTHTNALRLFVYVNQQHYTPLTH